MRTPESVAAAFLAHVEAAEWLAAAGLLDPVQVAQWYASILEAPEPQAVRIEPEVFRRNDPDMPDAVAAYLAGRQNSRTPEAPDHLLQRFAHVADREQLRALGPLEAAARFIEALDHRYRVAQQVRQQQLPADRADAIVASLPWVTYRVLGAVRASPALAYIVYEQSHTQHLDDGPAGPPGLVWAVLRDEWRVSMEGGIFDGNSAVSFWFDA